MISLFKDNINIILIILVVYEIANELLLKVRSRLNKTKIFQNNRTRYFLKSVSIYGGLAYLITLQQTNRFISLGNEENHMTLTISILTLYGIFYVFIQFAIQYGSDKFWGRSKTKYLLTRSTEYKFFDSNIFKLLLMTSTIFSILSREIMFNIILLNPYKNFIIALWDVSIFVIYILYILLFIRSLFIMRDFFSIQENNDFSVNENIKDDILESYKSFFYRSKNNYFIKVLINDAERLNSKEKGDMLLGVIFDTFNDYKMYQIGLIKKVNTNTKIKKKHIKKLRQGISNLNYTFKNLWIYIDNHEFDLDFKILLQLYKLQDSILFNDIYINCQGINEQIIRELNLVYADNSFLSIKKSLYFRIPKIVWDKIINLDQLIELNTYISNREATLNLLQIYEKNFKYDELPNDEQILTNGYKAYLFEILDKCKMFEDKLKEDDLSNLFSTYNLCGREMRINSFIQDQIYNYIIKQEYSSLNKKYVKILLSILDYKYTIAFIFYKMLYIGYDLWKDDTLFFKMLNNHGGYYEKIDSDKNINFVCKTIKYSNISDRIGNNLITWIIKNVKSDINEKIIQKCIDTPHITYTKFLKFKYIFSEYDSLYPDFSNISRDNLKQSSWIDWQLGYFNEILRTPYLLNERFFIMHHYRFCEEFFKQIDSRYLCDIRDFRILYTNIYFILNQEQFCKLISENKLVLDSLIEFLILKIDDENYEYLFLNYEISKIFKTRVIRIINRSNAAIEDYIEDLSQKANECVENSIPTFKKERIIFRLKKLLY